MLPQGRNQNWRGSPIIDQIRLDYFLKMLEDDVNDWEVPLPIEGQLIQSLDLGETEWRLNLVVPVSHTLGDYLFCRLEGIN